MKIGDYVIQKDGYAYAWKILDINTHKIRLDVGVFGSSWYPRYDFMKVGPVLYYIYKKAKRV